MGNRLGGDIVDSVALDRVNSEELSVATTSYLAAHAAILLDYRTYSATKSPHAHFGQISASSLDSPDIAFPALHRNMNRSGS